MVRILALDPSGTGTTGFCLINQKITFHEFQSKDWKEHLEFIVNEVETCQPAVLLYENTHYIHEKTQDSLDLFRLLGAIEGLTSTFPQIQRLDSILVHQVKDLKKQVLKGVKKIPGLEFKTGQGWFYQQNKISLHQLDAFLVYWLWKEAHG